MLGTKWAKKIDPERLALESGSACILGQVFGDYIDGIDELNLRDSNGVSETMARQLGFCADRSHGIEYTGLDAEWKKLLRNRKRQAARNRNTIRVPIV
jgi:hypothetical protein